MHEPDPGYPYRRDDQSQRVYRNPYEEGVLGAMLRHNNPLTGQAPQGEWPPDNPRVDVDRVQNRLPPLLTVTSPSNNDRGSMTPPARRGNEQYPRFLRGSETPPPPARRQTQVLPSINNMLNPVAPSCKLTLSMTPADAANMQGSGQPSSPGAPRPTDPYRPEPVDPNRPYGPYGGFPPPRNPFGPGGALYDKQRASDVRPSPQGRRK